MIGQHSPTDVMFDALCAELNVRLPAYDPLFHCVVAFWSSNSDSAHIDVSYGGIKAISIEYDRVTLLPFPDHRSSPHLAMIPTMLYKDIKEPWQRQQIEQPNTQHDNSRITSIFMKWYDLFDLNDPNLIDLLIERMSIDWINETMKYAQACEMT